MGGDHAPVSPVQGAALALQRHPELEVVLVGDRDSVWREIERHDLHLPEVEIIHTPEVVEMDDMPVAALRSKKNSSITEAVELHCRKQVDAIVSAGNTGAQIMVSIARLGKLEGVSRPVIGSFIPTLNEKPCLLLDVGANIDCRAMHLFQFGIMGSIFVEEVLGVEKARVGLLSIGTEEMKGNETTVFAHQLFKESHLEFLGNIEGSDLLTGKVDVAVCDGFVGNLILKFGETFPSFILSKLEASGNGCDPGSLKKFVGKHLHPDLFGGVPILGINGVSVVCHGSSSATAIANAVKVAADMAEMDINHKIFTQISDIRRFYEMNQYFINLMRRWEDRRSKFQWNPGRLFNWWFSEKDRGEEED